MDEIKEYLKILEDKIDKLEEKNKSKWFMEKVFPVIITAFLGLAGLLLTWNQVKISNNQVKLQESKILADSLQQSHELELKELQNQVNIDHKYVELVYNDILSKDENRKNGALKLIKKMRPDMAIVFIEMFENNTISEKQNEDIQEVQLAYTNALKKEKVTIGIHRLNYSSESSLNNIIHLLKDNKYQIIGNFGHSKKPSWMALNSTVFYYGDKKSKQRAQNIAKDLALETKLKFTVQKGAGLGVDKKRKNYHHFIHIIGN